MARGKKITYFLAIIFLFQFIIACKTQYPTSEVRLYEGDCDSLFMSEIQSNTDYSELFDKGDSALILELMDADTTLLSDLTEDDTIDITEIQFPYESAEIELESLDNSFYYYETDSSNFVDKDEENMKMLQGSLGTLLTEIREIREVLDHQQSQIDIIDYRTGKVDTVVVYSEKSENKLKDKKNRKKQNTASADELKAKKQAEEKNQQTNQQQVNQQEKQTVDTVLVIKEIIKPVDSNVEKSGRSYDEMQEMLRQKTNRVIILSDSIQKMQYLLSQAKGKTETKVETITKTKIVKDTEIVYQNISNNDTVILVANYLVNKVVASNQQQIIQELNKLNISKIKSVGLSGYTDVTGSYAVNKRLTDTRLGKIRNLLNKNGISDKKIFIQNFANKYSSKSVVESERKVEIAIVINK